jgi:hypothetical protein
MVKRAEIVQELLSSIQREIWNNILPSNSNFLADLAYVIDNQTKLNDFMRGTDQFEEAIINFQKNLDVFDQSQRNWIAGLIQSGAGQLWAKTADDFDVWIRQCNSRIDAEREGLR